jgi:hypothetical protein
MGAGAAQGTAGTITGTAMLLLLGVVMSVRLRCCREDLLTCKTQQKQQQQQQQRRKMVQLKGSSRLRVSSAKQHLH